MRPPLMRPARHTAYPAVCWHHLFPRQPQSVSHPNAAEPGVARGTRRRGATATPVSRALLSPLPRPPAQERKALAAPESDLCWAGRVPCARCRMMPGFLRSPSPHLVRFLPTDYNPECGEEPDAVSVHGHMRANFTIFTPSSLGRGNKDHEVVAALASSLSARGICLHGDSCINLGNGATRP